MTMDKRSLQESVREILLRDWDPNHVGENPSLRDEYDGYISGILSCSTRGDAEAAVFEALDRIERDTGMPVAEDDRRRAARAIAALFR